MILKLKINNYKTIKIHLLAALNKITGIQAKKKKVF